MEVADRILMKGNEALAEGAIRAGCRFFFGYPITPQNEIPEYMSRRMPEVGGTFLQAESEVAAISMVYGAAGAGVRVLTSSSGPGISLKQEGISYLVGSQLPCVIANVVRGGPGLGGIQPAQSDYFQATRGGGHGDYQLVVLAPASVQEMFDLTAEAFEVADAYRNPVMVLADGILGQMMEPILPSRQAVAPEELPDKPWSTKGKRGRAGANLINSLFLDPADLKEHNLLLQEKFARAKAAEVRVETAGVEDAKLVMVAYGTVARIARRAMQLARAKGLKVGLIRPISLWPFPTEALSACLGTADAFLAVEMSHGQMVDDVRLAVCGRAPVYLHGVTGVVPTAREVLAKIEAVLASASGSGGEGENL